LNGDTRYVARLLDRARSPPRATFHRLVSPRACALAPLNRRPLPELRGRAPWVNVPFSTGGLFEPSPLERSMGPRYGQRRLARRASTTFSRFPLLRREHDAGDFVAPDMLGRVFEAPWTRRAPQQRQLLPPASLVRELVAPALEALLTQAFGLSPRTRRAVGARRRLLRRPVPPPICAGLTVLDPAGIRRLLAGALDELVRRRQAGRGRAGP